MKLNRREILLASTALLVGSCHSPQPPVESRNQFDPFPTAPIDSFTGVVILTCDKVNKNKEFLNKWLK